ncbi:MAG: peptidylprolyl isomerase [Proteobacteria bacterium]|nr:hypothetical protein [Desulfobulbaceae bacterium]MBU4152536.1 peptidylprolyl isomerase [Pseudomonadota bacterium]
MTALPLRHVLTHILILIQIIAFAAGCSKVEKEKYAATINKAPITNDELQAEMNRIKQRFYNTSPMTDQQATQMESEILEIMIGGELLYQASQKAGIQVTEQEAKAQMEKSKTQFPDTDKFKNTFTEQDIRKKIATEKFITKEFADTTVITDEQGHKYYETNLADFTRPEQVLVTNILIKVKKDASDEEKNKAMAKLKAVKKELEQGGDFAKLAQKHSEDGNAASGGMMGFVLRGQTEKAFEEAAFTLDPDKTTIVETQAGYHLIRATDKKETKIVPYEDVADKLRNFLKQQEIQKKIDTFIKDEREKAVIEIFTKSAQNEAKATEKAAH